MTHTPRVPWASGPAGPRSLVHGACGRCGRVRDVVARAARCGTIVVMPDRGRPARRRAEQLGELVNGRPEHVADAVPELAALLAALLASGGDDATTREVVVALGHAWDDRAVQVLLAADLTAHPGRGVRLALAQALGGGLPAAEIRAGAVEQLLRLSADPAADVRDWACFGLGVLYADGAAVREALAARLDDPDGDTRDEALVALGRTGDRRALTRAGRVLADPDERGVTLLQLQAAVELAAPELLPVLGAITQEWSGDDDEHTARLDRALRRSTPQAAARAAALERRLVDAVNERLAGRAQAVHLAGRYPRTTPHFRTEHEDAGWWRRLWEDDDPSSLDLPLDVDTWIVNAP